MQKNHQRSCPPRDNSFEIPFRLNVTNCRYQFRIGLTRSGTQIKNQKILFLLDTKPYLILKLPVSWVLSFLGNLAPPQSAALGDKDLRVARLVAIIPSLASAKSSLVGGVIKTE